MNYKANALKLFHKLGIHKMYKGCEYIISSINYISQNETYFTPVTKVLYVEIAKQYTTSSICVEKNIRSVIKRIWCNPDNKVLLSEIFSEQFGPKCPTNVEFLMTIYHYLKQTMTPEHSGKLSPGDYTFICPLSGNNCEFCKEFIIEKLNRQK